MRRPGCFVIERYTSVSCSIFCGLSRRRPAPLRAAVATRAREDGFIYSIRLRRRAESSVLFAERAVVARFIGATAGGAPREV